MAPHEIPENLVKNARVILVDGYESEAALQLLQWADHYQVPSVIDIETGDLMLTERYFSLATDIILPYSEAQRFSKKNTPEEVLFDLRLKTKARLVITDGARGSWGLEENTMVHFPAFIINAIDTTGCGDVYHGGYAAAILWGFTFIERLEFASYIASRVATEFGGRTRLPTVQEIMEEKEIPLSEVIKQKIKESQL